jgi:CubicO group peptidase (beta-lactamase class C family)
MALHRVFSRPGAMAFPLLVAAAVAVPTEARGGEIYFPPPDSQGGWRTANTAEEVRQRAGLDLAKLNAVFDEFSASTKNGGLLVVRHGWLAFESYFGLGSRDATPNLASCGKSFTSIAVGILMAEHPELFPKGLEQQIFAPAYLPPEAFPLSDPAKADIKLGQLLAFTAGIRGNSPGRTGGQRVPLDPPGPDGWQAMVEAVAVGKRDIAVEGRNTSTATLWCPPGEGYSYATASIHLGSMMVRHVSGMELEPFVKTRMAEPMGWGPFTFGYKNASEVTHTPGGAGIAVRATDVLRFCYLLLHKGRWQDRQLVPAEYVEHCGRRSPYNPHSPYSLQFDVNSDGHIPGVPRDAFWKTGSGGHVLYIVPSLDLVIWKLAGRDNQYQQSNTGVPLPPDSVKGGERRSNWKATTEIDSMQLLQRIVAATTGRSATAAPPESVNVPLPPHTVLVGEGGVDGTVATGRDGTVHVVFGGKHRQGPAPDRLGPEEMITDLKPVNTVRMAIDGRGQPHVVFTTGMTSAATRSYYTTRIGNRWLPAEKIADAAEIPGRSRAYVADVTADDEGNVLASYWINRPTGSRFEREIPTFHYRWRGRDGRWGEPQSLTPAHWSSTPKVEFQRGRGFFLLWQFRGTEWRITGPISAGGRFVEDQGFATGSEQLTGVSNIQNEGAEFSFGPDGRIIAASNVREAFEGPVGVWASVGRAGEMSATFLGSFADTKRGDESGVHPVVTIDAATGASFLTVMSPTDKRAYYVVHRMESGWERSYIPLLPGHSAPQGTLRQGPSVADLPGPGVVALVRDREQRWYLRVLTPGEK